MAARPAKESPGRKKSSNMTNITASSNSMPMMMMSVARYAMAVCAITCCGMKARSGALFSRTPTVGYVSALSFFPMQG